MSHVFSFIVGVVVAANVIHVIDSDYNPEI
jgi:hypothetical protein